MSGKNFPATNRGGFPQGADRNNPIGIAIDRNHRRNTGNGVQRAVEAKLAHHVHIANHFGRQPLSGNQDPNSNRKIEAGPGLSMMGRSEVHRDASIWPIETAGENRSTHAIACFATRLVGKAEHREAGKTGTHMNLHRHRMAMGAAHRGRMNIRNHGNTP